MESFEKWLNSQKSDLSEDVIGLFSDSLRCFKNNILRPAYLLAYQGMILSLRERILQGKKPDGFEEGEWRQICKEICIDHKWDENTFDRIVQEANSGKGKPAILCMRKEVRKQFPYWRNLRNVCAHYKEFKFKPAHVITLYTFIESNLMKISVEGSAASLLSKFKDYCDISKYSQDTPLLPLVQQIPVAVEENDIKDFVFNTIKIVCKQGYRDSKEYIRDLLFIDGEIYDTLRNAIREILREHHDVRDGMIRSFPDLGPVLLVTPVEVREYWTRSLQFTSNPLAILAELFHAKRIPEAELEEVFGKVLGLLYDGGRGIYDTNQEQLDILKSYGYFKYFVTAYINPHHFNEFPGLRANNYKTDFFIDHLMQVEPGEDILRALSAIFDGENGVPYTLRDRIRDEIWAREGYSEKFLEIAAKLNIEPPKF